VGCAMPCGSVGVLGGRMPPPRACGRLTVMKYSASSDEEDKRKGGQEKAERRECVGWAHLSCLDRLVPHLDERDIVKREGRVF
jgi:hypothetical protein